MADGRTVDSFYYDVRAGKGMSFHFTVRDQQDGSKRIYIDEQPCYPSVRLTDGHSTHRYGLAGGEPYIGDDPQPRSLKDARTIAESWARHTARYITTGEL